VYLVNTSFGVAFERGRGVQVPNAFVSLAGGSRVVGSGW
jgi:hypothetical protein